MKTFDSLRFAGVGDYIVSVSGSTGDYDLTLRNGETIEEYDETAGVYSTAAPTPGDVLLKGTQTGSRTIASTDWQVIPSALAGYLLRQKDHLAMIPTVLSPLDEAVDVAVDAVITVTFNKDIASKVDAKVAVDDGAAVACTITNSGAVLTITPDADMEFETEHTVTVTTGAVLGDAGNTNETFSFTFTTAAEA